MNTDPAALKMKRMCAKPKQFLPARAALLEDYWKKTVEKWRFSEVDFFSARNNFSGWYNPPNYPNHYAFAALLCFHNVSHPTP
jgi:hypothetical protein